MVRNRTPTALILAGLSIAQPVEAEPSMVTFETGCFTMGCPEYTRCYSAFPRHQVCLDAYEMDKAMVSQTEYEACVTADACHAPVRCSSDDGDRTDGPATCVSWSDAA